jgi:DNA-nicking Smr family endonuclease
MAAGGEAEPPDELVHLPIEDSLDLHSFRPADVPSVVDEYLAQAHERGYAEVRLIHGRGIGVQRAIVQSLLARHPLVLRYADAPEDRGGRGATLVTLRRP